MRADNEVIKANEVDFVKRGPDREREMSTEKQGKKNKKRTGRKVGSAARAGLRGTGG